MKPFIEVVIALGFLISVGGVIISAGAHAWLTAASALLLTIGLLTALENIHLLLESLASLRWPSVQASIEQMSIESSFDRDGTGNNYVHPVCCIGLASIEKFTKERG